MAIFKSVRSFSLIFGCSFLLGMVWWGNLQQASSLHAQELVTESERIQVIVEIDTDTTPLPYLRGATAEQSRQIQIDLAQHRIESRLPANTAVVHHYQSFPYSVMTISSEDLNTLQAVDGVVSIFENTAVAFPLLGTSTPAIGMDTVWESGYDGSGQTVVVLDSGIYTDHSFFGGRVVDEACFSSALGTLSTTIPFAQATPSSTHSLCPNEAGTQLGLGSANPIIPTCLKSGGGQICDHGTHVAGTAAGGDGEGGQSYDGVARGANLIGIQIFTRFNDCTAYNIFTPCISAFNSDLLAALDYVYTTLQYSHTIASVNMSLGGGAYTDQAVCDTEWGFLKEPIDKLRTTGIATIIASGNNGYTNTIAGPACISSAIAVGSTADKSGISPFSNSDEMIELLAPGSAVFSSLASGGYGGYNGTSMASPHVAGAWAVAREISPSITITDLLTVFQTTGIPISDTRAGGQHIKSLIQVDLMMAEIAPAGALAANPQMLEVYLAPDRQLTETVSIQNVGGLPLVWQAADCGGATPSWLTLNTTGDVTTTRQMPYPLGLQFDSTLDSVGHYTTTICLQDNTAITTELAVSLIITTPQLVLDVSTDLAQVETETTEVGYTIVLSNEGAVSATHLILTSTIPAETTFVSASDGGGETTAGSGVVVWPSVSLASNQRLSRTIQVAVNPGQITAGLQITNRVIVGAQEISAVVEAIQTETVVLTMYPLYFPWIARP